MNRALTNAFQQSTAVESLELKNIIVVLCSFLISSTCTFDKTLAKQAPVSIAVRPTSNSRLVPVVPVTHLKGLTFTNAKISSLLQAESRFNNITPFWFPLNTKQPRWQQYYALSWYFPNNKSVRLISEPCGTIPSEGCFRQMLNLSIRTSDTQRYCARTVYNTMLHDIPRWTVNVSLSRKNSPRPVDSHTLIYLALSSLLTNLLNTENCYQSVISIHALRKNLFTVPVPANITKRLFNRLKIPRNATSNKFPRTNTSLPVTVRQFSDMTILMFYRLYTHFSCSAATLYGKTLNDTRNATVYTIFGPFNATSLLPGNVTVNDITHERRPQDLRKTMMEAETLRLQPRTSAVSSP